MKLTLKINLLFTIIVSGILLVIAIIIYNISRQNINRDFKEKLGYRAVRTATLYSGLRNDTTNLLKSLDAAAPPVLANIKIRIFDEGKRVLYSYQYDSSSLPITDTSMFEKARKERQVFFRIHNTDVCLYYDDVIPGEYLMVMVAAENVTGRQYINNLKKLFFLFLPASLIITLLVGYIFSRSLVKPVRESIRDVKLITTQNLSHRLYEGKGKDELSELNTTFNDLLDRLEESFSIQRRFISNASHELSTPLTSISSQIEVALLQNRSEEEYRRVLKSVREDMQDLQQLTQTLLEIAKAGTHGAISLDKVRIDEVLVKAHNEVLQQDSSYNIDLIFPEFPETENECLVFGNNALLQSAFKNIMENGCKYSPDRSVKVELLFKGNVADIIFSNKSDMLNSEEMSKIFEPFYRSSNAEGKPGVGLGLTLTRRIIGLHKGTLSAFSDAERGTVFVIMLPTLDGS